MMISRRTFIKTVGAAAGMAGLAALMPRAVSQTTDGRTLREYQITALDQEIEIAPGVYFPAWTYNGQVPGPTFRCTEGALLRFHFTNSSSHEHTIHFHGNHPP